MHLVDADVISEARKGESEAVLIAQECPSAVPAGEALAAGPEQKSHRPSLNRRSPLTGPRMR